MSKKWGESFLKSGLPLEHLTASTFRSLGWDIESNLEYFRENKDGDETWFELDLFATNPNKNNETELGFLIECKYHDASRFWIFLPCGVCRNSQGSLDTDKLFTGQRLDDTGLYYYNARYYDATIGRFTSPDTTVQDYKNPQTLNRYSYCDNNPLKYTDPTGYHWWNKVGHWFSSAGHWIKQHATQIAAVAFTVIAVVATVGAAAPVVAAA